MSSRSFVRWTEWNRGRCFVRAVVVVGAIVFGAAAGGEVSTFRD